MYMSSVAPVSVGDTHNRTAVVDRGPVGEPTRTTRGTSTDEGVGWERMTGGRATPGPEGKGVGGK